MSVLQPDDDRWGSTDVTTLTDMMMIAENNTNDTVTLSTGKYPAGTLVLAKTSAIVILTLGVTGNIITMWSLLSAKKLWNTTMPFVISLCLSDLAFCVTVLPMLLLRYFTQQWALWDSGALCLLYPFFMYGTIGTSMLNLTFITVSQYFMVIHKNRARDVFSKRNIYMMLAAVWLLPYCLLVLPLSQVWGEIGYDHTRYSCTFLGKSGRAFQYFLHMIGFFLPTTIIAVCYIRIFVVYRRARSKATGKATVEQREIYRRMSLQLERMSLANINEQHVVPSPAPVVKHAHKRFKRYDIRLAVTMFVTFVAFVVSFLPFTAARVAFKTLSLTHPTAYVVCAILVWLHCCLNPLIYVILNKRFRRAYFTFFGCKRRDSGGGGNSEWVGTSTVMADGCLTVATERVGNSHLNVSSIGNSHLNISNIDNSHMNIGNSQLDTSKSNSQMNNSAL